MAKFRVELEANDWQKVLGVLVNRPYIEIAQLVQAISTQLSQPPVPPTNGEAQPAQQAGNG